MTSATAFNRALYNEFWNACPDFSRYNPGALHRRRIIGKLVRSVPFRSVLDVGCGDAQLLMWLRSYAPRNTDLWGVDLSPDTIDANRKRHPFARFAVLNLENATIDRQFDLVICTEVIEHLEKRAEAIRHLAEMLEPGGHLIVTCPTGKVHTTERHFGHIAHPTPSELASMLEEPGLRVVSLQNWGFPVYSALKTATNVNPEWALKNFAAGKYSPSARATSRALYWMNFLNLSSSRRGCQLFALAQRPH